LAWRSTSSTVDVARVLEVLTDVVRDFERDLRDRFARLGAVSVEQRSEQWGLAHGAAKLQKVEHLDRQVGALVRKP